MKEKHSLASKVRFVLGVLPGLVAIGLLWATEVPGRDSEVPRTTMALIVSLIGVSTVLLYEIDRWVLDKLFGYGRRHYKFRLPR